jgi:environmental stress-induced protein Ves
MQIRKADTLLSSRWSGGTTTELFLFPAGSSYAERNFDLRISRATVEISESEFTPLPGYSRILMVLDGTLTMCHETPAGQQEVRLRPLEQDSFSGDWKTIGYGEVRDFNVFFKDGYSVSVSHCVFAAGTRPDPVESPFLKIVFLLSGTAEFGSFGCTAGDVVIYENELALQGQILTDCTCIVVDVTGS